MNKRQTAARMRRVLSYVSLVCLLGVPQTRGQSPTLQGIIGDVNPDTLLTTLRILTGEEGSTDAGQGDTIFSRGYKMPGKGLAASFLGHRLAGFGLPVVRDTFQWAFAPISGVNILAEQVGARFPDQKYILCAHYDAVGEDTHDTLAPGADDNATGVTAVLEAARLLSAYQTDYTVLFALWDCEEMGTIGSDAYALAARTRGDSIIGVINLDMIGTDATNDSLTYVAACNAREIADTMAQLCQLYQLGLKPRLVFPGNQSSDHASFLRQKYRAMMLIAYHAFSSPVNHTSLDRIDRLNLNYFHRMTKLAVATIAFLAGAGGTSSIRSTEAISTTYRLEPNYPNPFNPSTTIRFALPHRSHFTLTVFNTLGQTVAELVRGELDAGDHEAKFNGGGLASGVYFYRLRAGDFVQTRKLVLLH